MIILKNDGLIDIDLITTMGVSVKESENPIGYFGTGLKYAIATFLRHGVEFYLRKTHVTNHHTLTRPVLYHRQGHQGHDSA